MTAFVPESIKVLGSDAGGASVVLCDMFVDTLADLPAPDTFTGFRLSMGCKATVINDNSKHQINSEGQWVQISAGTSTYTKTEIDSMIARIDATVAEDRTALVAQVDGGAKNLCNVEDLPTTTAAWKQADLGNGVKLSAGEYVLSFTNITSNTGGTLMQIIFADNLQSFNQTSDYYHITKGSNTSIKIKLTGDTTAIRIYAGNSYAESQGKSLSFSGMMICTAADWAISQKFVPYRPSWQEMADNNKIIDITSQITAESGYTVESTTHMYYQNKLVFGTIAVAINSGSYSSSLTAIAKLPVEYAPARQYLVSCGFSTDQWSITNIGYAFIQGANASSTAQRGQISVKSPTAKLTHMILDVCYSVQIDSTI